MGGGARYCRIAPPRNGAYARRPGWLFGVGEPTSSLVSVSPSVGTDGGLTLRAWSGS